MITDWATFNSSSIDNREWKSSTNESSAFAVTLSRQLYKPGAWENVFEDWGSEAPAVNENDNVILRTPITRTPAQLR